MFDKLQKKWGISGSRFFWVMVAFGFTGTTTAWITAQITGWLSIEKFSTTFWLLKIGMLLIGYQVLLLFYGFLFGQFKFFWHYERKILSRMGILPKIQEPYRLAVFASGAGSNARKLIEYFNLDNDRSKLARVTLIVCNKPEAGVVKLADEFDIPVLHITKEELESGAHHKMLKKRTDWLILAGFLLKIPPALIQLFPRKIINLHPALLPLHGGKGMYGNRVHEAVIASGARESGITIHYVDDQYDHGEVIFQAVCPIAPEDTPETLAKKIHSLEHLHYPEVVAGLLQNAKNALNTKK
ncbi:MAG TPA: phosphoribosylglycinamide formyltransferase [Ferruginibacter sp.]|nr:phosphoribosylglycinamide formyltransferase [Ferruginibacter sp.]